MKVLVIGAMGHIGSYLVPELVLAGHSVYAVSRGNRQPYGKDEAIWDKVVTVHASREELVASDIFEREHFDAVCDLVAFSVDQVRSITDKLVNDEFYLQIGSIWAYGSKLYVPVDESHPHNAVKGSYGDKKGLIEDYLLEKSKKGELRCTVVHPGHISAKEWDPVNPAGNDRTDIYDKIRAAEEIILPHFGIATLHHVHSYDLAQIIMACLEKQDIANGEAFIATAESTMTMRAIAEGLYRHFGHEPNIRYVTDDEFRASITESDYAESVEHISHSPACTCKKAIDLLGVRPKYSVLDVFKEYVDYRYSM